MKTRLVLSLFVLTWASSVFAADVPVYPGALVDARVTKAIQEQDAENVAYTTTDPFDKVDKYYKSLGGQDAPHSRVVNDATTMVGQYFPGKKFYVFLSRLPGDPRHVTEIQIIVKQ